LVAAVIIGALRIKNEARWIERVVRSIQPVCDRVIILDDHSDDGTPDICESLGADVHHSSFDGINEARDKNYLLELVWGHASPGDWCLMVDGDEILHPGDWGKLQHLTTLAAPAWSQRILYLWDREDQVRVDGVYRNFHRGSFFRLLPGAKFQLTGAGGNLHCSSVPDNAAGACQRSDVRLLHLGYLHREDRIRKFEWYNRIDPHNRNEDGYRHMVIGDIFPSDSRFRHGGPLQLELLQ
jgi:glycosyltransferase involved in cell wall biosynthesis